MIHYETDLTRVDWKAAAEVVRRAPLGTREPEKMARAFRNSYATVAAFDDQQLIGLARALCDGEYHAAIYDVVLLPDYQGRHIGQEMLRRLCAQLPVATIILFANPGREGFYAKLGFRKMLTAMAIMHPSRADPARGYLEPDGAQPGLGNTAQPASKTATASSPCRSPASARSSRVLNSTESPPPPSLSAPAPARTKS